MNKLSAMAFLCILGSTTVGCVAQTGDSDPEVSANDSTSAPEELLAPAASPGEGRDVSGLNLGPTYTEYGLPAQGGWGGTYSGHVGGGVIYAVRMNAGAYIDNIQLAYYIPSYPDNYYRSGDFWANTQSFGGGGGVNTGWIYCPAGMGVIGIRGGSGALVDRLQIVCSDVNNPDPNSPYNWTSYFYGGGGGVWFSNTCLNGYLINALNIRSGALVDNLQGICVSAH